MISPADDEPEPRRDTAEVRLTDLPGNALLPQDSRDTRQFHVGAEADITVYAKLHASMERRWWYTFSHRIGGPCR